ncbi:MAG: hypothetical protein WHT46_02290 [Candidatus Geothermincolales bacterium]
MKSKTAWLVATGILLVLLLATGIAFAAKDGRDGSKAAKGYAVNECAGDQVRSRVRESSQVQEREEIQGSCTEDCGEESCQECLTNRERVREREEAREGSQPGSEGCSQGSCAMEQRCLMEQERLQERERCTDGQCESGERASGSENPEPENCQCERLENREMAQNREMAGK